MPEIEVIPLGGYSDFGRNMTCVRVGREAVIFDIGIKLDRILLHEDAVFDEMHPLDLQKLGAIPDDTPLANLGAKVVAIVIGHGHLDHVGAVAKLAGKYRDAPIIATPYTCALIENMIHAGPPGKKGEKRRRLVPNKVTPMNAGERRSISKTLELEFVHTTHSIVQTVFPVLHTPRGAIVYANDYKFDNSPVIGSKPNYKRLRQLSMEGVLALICESTNAGQETKTPSEAIARDMLKDYLFGLDNERVAVTVSTFSSHTARIKSICEFGDELGREVMLLGRSMDKYTTPAVELGLLQLPASTTIYGYGRAVEGALRKVNKDPGRYLLVATGHQGEPDALVPRIANGDLPYKIEKDHQVIFSANVIPNPVNVANRYILETKLRMQGARIIKGAHVSGHACAEDHRELLAMLEPEHVFPAHGGIDLQAQFVELAETQGFRLNESVHILRNSDRFLIPKKV
ncbi:MAG TPA: RNase J family beta-CASP ribonuclease [Candidatus Thermoplasmatota archaeon]|nr:RNase J family beta-CASP ribonuclease [Candidatus Thermoplasmatota archaeon]